MLGKAWRQLYPWHGQKGEAQRHRVAIEVGNMDRARELPFIASLGLLSGGCLYLDTRRYVSGYRDERDEHPALVTVPLCVAGLG